MRSDADIAAQLEALSRLTAWDVGAGFAIAEWAATDGDEATRTSSAERPGLFDAPHAQLRGWHVHGAASHSGAAQAHWRRKPLAGWLLLSVGLASFFCGAALLTWSLMGNRPDLWTMGVPITLAGQVGLLLGVVLALDRLGQQNRRTNDYLGRLDERLDELRAAAWLNAPASPSPHQSAHADGGEPLY